MGLLTSWNKSLRENYSKLLGTPQDVRSSDCLTPTACLAHFDYGSLPAYSVRKKERPSGVSLNCRFRQWTKMCFRFFSYWNGITLIFLKTDKNSRILKFIQHWNKCLNIVVPFFFTSGLFQFSDIIKSKGAVTFFERKDNLGFCCCWQALTIYQKWTLLRNDFKSLSQVRICQLFSFVSCRVSVVRREGRKKSTQPGPRSGCWEQKVFSGRSEQRRWERAFRSEYDSQDTV